MRFFILSEEETWRDRRVRRMQRYGHVFQGRVTPGLKKGASKEARMRAGKSIAKIKKSAEKWSARGAKGGAGGKIRSEPAYMKRLIKSYSKKKMNLSKNMGKPGGGGYWKESVDAFVEAYKRAQRLKGVAGEVNKAARTYRTTKSAGEQKSAKLRGLRGAGILARKVGTLHGDKAKRSSSARRQQAKTYGGWSKKFN